MPQPTSGDNKPKYNPNDYVPFGQHADYAFQQGWMPTDSNNGAVIYRNKYNNAFGNVITDGKPQGTIQLRGNRNGLFDVELDKGNGKVMKIMTSQPFSQVDNYFRNQNSVIQQRMNRVQNDPNTQVNGIAWNQ
jgi:hypothetical protein